MDFVKNDTMDSLQGRILLHSSQEDAVGAEDHLGAGQNPAVATHHVTHFIPETCVHFFGYSCRNADRCKAARLTDNYLHVRIAFVDELGDLRGLVAASLSGNHESLMTVQRLQELETGVPGGQLPPSSEHGNIACRPALERYLCLDAAGKYVGGADVSSCSTSIAPVVIVTALIAIIAGRFLCLVS